MKINNNKYSHRFFIDLFYLQHISDLLQLSQKFFEDHLLQTSDTSSDNEWYNEL